MSPPRTPKRASPPKGQATPIPPDQLMTVKKAAAVLAVCEKTVRRWIGAGRLLPIRNGRSVRLRVRDVRDLTRPE